MKQSRQHTQDVESRDASVKLPVLDLSKVDQVVSKAHDVSLAKDLELMEASGGEDFSGNSQSHILLQGDEPQSEVEESSCFTGADELGRSSFEITMNC